MVDVESRVFTACSDAFKAGYPQGSIDGKHEAKPASFPAVEVIEISNVEASDLHDSSGRENGSLVTYEVNCYSNNRENGKAQVKDIAGLMDATMRSMGFERTFGQFLYNAADSAVHRYTMRYTGTVRQNGKDDFSIYRR